jgi:hypothetical protein
VDSVAEEENEKILSMMGKIDLTISLYSSIRA